MTTRLNRRALLTVSAALLAAGALPRRAFALTPEEEIVERSRIAVSSMLSDSNFRALKDYIVRARGVMIFPNLLKGSFLFGAEGGSGVFLVRQKTDNAWSYPAFYFFGSASFGLQAGGQVSEAVFTFMNDDAVDRVLRNKFKLGADASVALGPVGGGVEAGTAGGFDSDIYVFARAEGVFAGLSVEGGLLEVEDGRMRYYYGKDLTAAEVVLEGKGVNLQADGLRSALPL